MRREMFSLNEVRMGYDTEKATLIGRDHSKRTWADTCYSTRNVDAEIAEWRKEKGVRLRKEHRRELYMTQDGEFFMFYRKFIIEQLQPEFPPHAEIYRFPKDTERGDIEPLTEAEAAKLYATMSEFSLEWEGGPDFSDIFSPELEHLGPKLVAKICKECRKHTYDTSADFCSKCGSHDFKLFYR